MLKILNWFLQFFNSPPPRPANTGVLEGNQDTDYFVGARAGQVLSSIPYKVRLTDGNWMPFAFDQERQYSDPGPLIGFGDSMSCVSHSTVNAIQAQEFFLTGKKVNYSKRWIAKMSETTIEGNYLWKVADTIRKYGLVLEEDYPTPTTFNFDEYHATIPEPKLSDLKAKGQQWLKQWTLQYEFLQISDPNLDKHLKHSPLVLVIPGHAVCGVYSPDELMTYLDSYPNWFKKAQVSILRSAMKPILTSNRILARQVGFANHPERGVYIPADSMERFKFIQENLPKWMPEYQLDASKTYILPTNKPDW